MQCKPNYKVEHRWKSCRFLPFQYFLFCWRVSRYLFLKKITEPTEHNIQTQTFLPNARNDPSSYKAISPTRLLTLPQAVITDEIYRPCLRFYLFSWEMLPAWNEVYMVRLAKYCKLLWHAVYVLGREEGYTVKYVPELVVIDRSSKPIVTADFHEFHDTAYLCCL